MPIYAYRCSACGHAQDVLQKLSDPLLTVCPSCGQATYAKQVTAAGFQLKGSGWYVTDFRDGAKGAKAGADKVADKAADTGAEKAAEKAADKPAEKAGEKAGNAAASGASSGDKPTAGGDGSGARKAAAPAAPSPAAPAAGS